jgi:hypothetical protein
MKSKTRKAAGKASLDPLVRCGTCAFFHRFTKKPRKGMRLVYGECRRMPPRPDLADEFWNENKRVPAGWIFPRVHEEIWCGQHTPNARLDRQEEAR